MLYIYIHQVITWAKGNWETVFSSSFFSFQGEPNGIKLKEKERKDRKAFPICGACCCSCWSCVAAWCWFADRWLSNWFHSHLVLLVFLFFLLPPSLLVIFVYRNNHSTFDAFTSVWRSSDLCNERVFYSLTKEKKSSSKKKKEEESKRKSRVCVNRTTSKSV